MYCCSSLETAVAPTYYELRPQRLGCMQVPCAAAVVGVIERSAIEVPDLTQFLADSRRTRQPPETPCKTASSSRKVALFERRMSSRYSNFEHVDLGELTVSGCGRRRRRCRRRHGAAR